MTTRTSFSNPVTYWNTIKRMAPCNEPDVYRNGPKVDYLSYFESADNPVAHRNYPDDPLSSMTSLAHQKTVRAESALLRWNKTNYCGSTPYTVEKRSHSGFFLIKAEDPTPTNWELKMRLKIKETSVNLGNTLVEYRDTARMFSRFASGLGAAWKLYRGRLPKHLRRRLRPCDVAAAELTYSYGVEPLVSDMYDSAERLNHRMNRDIRRRFFVRSRSNNRGTKINSNGDFVTFDWERTDHVTAYVKFHPNTGDFTIGNPAELAWEVIPFSFVVDWGLGVGDWLSALDALKDVSSLHGVVSTKNRYKHDVIPALVYGGDYFVEKGRCRMHLENHSREAINTIPMPSRPEWDPSKSWRAIMHGISLLTVLNQRCR